MTDKQQGTFKSGHEYTLAQIFSRENRIIIPDLQRDYCWGDNVHDKDGKPIPELVSGFLKSLKDVFVEKKYNNFTLGMIYGYEQPQGHIHLCDGQQRITTLFLLLGMLYRKTKAEELKKALISDYELNHDDKEPHLQYAIRESTLYFLSDLVSKVILMEGCEIQKIKNQDWYFADYDQDPTIQSMIAALTTIDKQLSCEIDCELFGKFILNELKLLYYDMGTRAQGEETFVVINTTGEPLTASENLKPILLGKLDGISRKGHAGEATEETDLKCYSRQWEEREEWFWQNRKSGEAIADNGVETFFEWFFQIRYKQEKVADLKGRCQKDTNPLLLLDEVHNCFLALKNCIEMCKCDRQITAVLNMVSPEAGEIGLSWFRNEKTDLNVVLPLIAYLEKFHSPKLYYEFVRRIRKNYFDKKRDRGNFVDWRYVVRIVELAHEEADILSFESMPRNADFVKIANVNLKEWYNDDEKLKDTLRNNHKAEVEKWEDHPDLMGDLTPFWKANESRENSFVNLQSIWSTFDKLYKCYSATEVRPQNSQMLSNYVRLYRVLIACPGIGHIERTSGMQGAWFSWKDQSSNEYLKYLNNSKFQTLWLLQEPDTVLDEIKARVRELLPRASVELSDDTFNAGEHLKAWLLLKVLFAEGKNVALSFHDGNGIASYDDCRSNKLNADPDLPFSLANSICGYAKTGGKGGVSRIVYCESQDYWGNPICINTPIGDHISLSVFNARGTTLIARETLEKVGNTIKMLLDKFYVQGPQSPQSVAMSGA